MLRRILASFLCVAFIATSHQPVLAQGFSVTELPAPGTMVTPTNAFVPLTLKGMIIHTDNALKFDFLMDTGHSGLKDGNLSDEALKIMKYFLTALTMPEDDLWVNLSPYEKGRIVEDSFGQTLMGRDLLAEDYILKQLTASVVYPENALGKEFWSEIYKQASLQTGSTKIPVNTFNKVWIVPSEAVVWEHEDKVMIVKSHLKVMLEEDYLSTARHQISGLNKNANVSAVDVLARDTVRKLVIPVLEKEVNEGKNFAKLRQMYQAMILATWYKKALKESILNKVYANQKKVKGVDNSDKGDIEAIYQQYLKAFKKGAFNYIKEDIDPASGKSEPRKYFSGGFSLKRGATSLATALLVLGSVLTFDQRQAVAQSSQPTGQIILVQGQIAEPALSVLSKDREKVFQESMNIIRDNPSTIAKSEALEILLKLRDRRAVGLVSELLGYEGFRSRDNTGAAGDFFDGGGAYLRKSAREALVVLGAGRDELIQANTRALKSKNKEAVEEARRALVEIDRDERIKNSADPFLRKYGFASNDPVRTKKIISDQELSIELRLNEGARFFDSLSGNIERGRKVNLKELQQTIEFVIDELIKMKNQDAFELIRSNLDVMEHILGDGQPYGKYRVIVQEKLKDAQVMVWNRLSDGEREGIRFIGVVAGVVTLLGLMINRQEIKDSILEQRRKRVIKSMPRLVEKREILLLRSYLDPKWGGDVRADALKSLLSLKEEVEIEKLLTDSSSKVRKVVRDYINGGGVDPERAYQANLLALNSDDHNMRYEALGFLGDKLDKRSIEPIVLMLEMGKGVHLGLSLKILSNLGANDQDMIRVYISQLSSSWHVGAAQELLKMDTFEHKDIIARLFERDPEQYPSGHQAGSLLKYFKDAVVYKKDGDDFKVIRHPGVSHSLEGYNDPITLTWVTGGQISDPDTFEVVRGDKLDGSSSKEKSSAMITLLPDNQEKLQDSSGSDQSLGGIALNSNMLDLQIKRDGNGVSLPINQQSLESINIQGFIPTIIDIKPINLPALMGLSS